MIDMVKLKIKAGDGGDGAVSFWREKFIPKGGPDGGDGGKGGCVYFVSDPNSSTFEDFRAKKVFGAQNGGAGGKKKMSGENGADLYLKVPLGTLIYEEVSGERRLVADLSRLGDSFLAGKGGRGGKGNFRFRSSTNQTPLQYIPGEAGEARDLTLELKIVADIGLVGLPNAGKSTLINKLTGTTNAKVANYNFTTLEPNLGVWELDRGRKVIIADIPGLIEGASKGKGLGDDFLRHVERTKVLIHLVDPIADRDLAVTPEKVYSSFCVIKHELASYSGGLWDITAKPQLVVINKADLTEVAEAMPAILELFKANGVEVFGISAATGLGLEELRKRLLAVYPKLDENAPQVYDQILPVYKKYTLYNLPGSTKRQVLTKNMRV
ncbi:MAG: GTPase obg [candidate division WWE3 bacterium GW2011_GWC2_44_9]|uniref:GTPase Obg n=3 Tax=Katanobacteria TaxID=422282 RepID=A0A0G1KMP0_UNCKA|nr:MAG: GTPase obg [candidate division WWE3 bacterium GW2011_GWA2_44_16]KKT84798.1 MAG: GTPase obg [candidate division WWE3 bacterium GW2011_GWC2_44_9]OGC51323.1 MAG: hypothetical protein A2709_01300 [candidate division WWE3 bacterium RIFCSPHIGHO2_01_FULL_43_9]